MSSSGSPVETSSRGRLAYLLSRAPAVLFSGVAVAALAGRLPDPTPEDVKSALSKELGVDAVIQDFVWLPSQGRTADLFAGRDVVFLARSAGESTVEAYRAKVRLTTWGHPLGAHELTPILPTALAEETGLVAQGQHFAFRVEREGVLQTIVLGSAAEHEAVSVLPLAAPAAGARLELAEGKLVALYANEGLTFAIGSEGPFRKLAANASSEPTAAVATARTPSAEATSFDGLVADVELVAGHPAVGSRGKGDAGLTLFDGRQLRFLLVQGWQTSTSTGFRPTGRPPSSAPMPVAAYVLRGLVGGGRSGPNALTPIAPNTPVLASSEGKLFVAAGEAALDGQSPDAVLPFVSSQAASESVVSYCATKDGHLAIAWGSSSTDAEGQLPASCASAITLPGRVERLPDPAAVAASGNAEPVLYLFPVSHEPSIKLEQGSWKAQLEGASAPTFLPALHQAEAEAFGTRVQLLSVDLKRYELRLVVGSSEKSHRLGGKFELGVPASMQAPALFQLPLGVGKRKRPRGLRSFGNLGHAFSSVEGVLEVGAGFGRVQAGRDQPICEVKGACAYDSSELPLSVDDGASTDASRQRGPLQSRADLCSLADGHLVIALSEFDSHEANATVLAQLGCARAVMVDRGSEPPVRFVPLAGSVLSSEDTLLVAFERAFLGNVSAP